MEEVGEILEVQGGKALVRLKREEACRSCGLCGLSAARWVELEVDNPLGAPPGAMVRVALASPRVATAAAFIYLLPALGFLAGVIGGTTLGRQPVELFGLGGGVAGVAASLAAVRAWQSWGSRRGPYPRVVEVLSAPGEEQKF
ncbi:MAG: SoxR reducing system RseC family protein [Bacillota bacterium]|nr:SoxR reducing system RseC family protein [Bacillota bacterium]